MSIIKTLDVFCDKCGTNWVHGCINGSAKKAREKAKQKHWKRIKKRDLCPKCAIEEQE